MLAERDVMQMGHIFHYPQAPTILATGVARRTDVSGKEMGAAAADLLQLLEVRLYERSTHDFVFARTPSGIGHQRG